MDNEMIERVTKAAYEKFNENLIPNLELSWEKLPEDFKFRMIEAQKEAIKAMREPTEKMKTLVTEEMVITDICYYCGGHIDGWRTMIDSITND